MREGEGRYQLQNFVTLFLIFWKKHWKELMVLMVLFGEPLLRFEILFQKKTKKKN
jgi:hypothetical protein